MSRWRRAYRFLAGSHMTLRAVVSTGADDPATLAEDAASCCGTIGFLVSSGISILWNALL